MGRHGAFSFRSGTKRSWQKIVYHSHMDNWFSTFEVLTLLCALNWRIQPVVNAEKKSPKGGTASLGPKSSEPGTFAKRRNSRFASRNTGAHRRKR